MSVLVEQPLLPPLEQRIFDVLTEEQGLVVRWQDLAMKVYGYADKGTYGALRTHVCHIRRRIGDDSIISIRGVGYRSGWQ